MSQNDYTLLNEQLELIKRKNKKINNLLLEDAMKLLAKLKVEEELVATLNSLKNIENYKTIKKSVALLEERLRELQTNNLKISKDIIQ